MAVDDDLLRKNPFEFELASVIVNDSVTREATVSYTHLPFVFGRMTRSLLLITNQATLIME